MSDSSTIDDYIRGFDQPVRSRLEAVRALIRATAPEATEKISYGIPTFDLHGNLVHYAAFDKHLGFYPGASGVAHFEAELGGYKRAKGSIQFPHDQELPLELIRRITAFRIAENLKLADERKARRAAKGADGILTKSAGSHRSGHR